MAFGVEKFLSLHARFYFASGERRAILRAVRASIQRTIFFNHDSRPQETRLQFARRFHVPRHCAKACPADDAADGLLMPLRACVLRVCTARVLFEGARPYGLPGAAD